MKIFDCFKFFNEFELLELRFMELDDVVDHFVLVEANKTQQGAPKEFLFEENKDRFEKWLDKIIHVKVLDMPDPVDGDIWVCENFQRNCIKRGLRSARMHDTVIVSDVDEIPHPQTILDHVDDKFPAVFRQKLYYYYVNCEQKSHWDGPIMTKYRTGINPQAMRFVARAGQTHVENGGWHYSYMGGPEKIKTKVASICEGPEIADKIGTVEEIEKKMKTQKDLWGRTEAFAKKSIVDISDTKPRHLDEWLKKYPEFFFDGY